MSDDGVRKFHFTLEAISRNEEGRGYLRESIHKARSAALDKQGFDGIDSGSLLRIARAVEGNLWLEERAIEVDRDRTLTRHRVGLVIESEIVQLEQRHGPCPSRVRRWIAYESQRACWKMWKPFISGDVIFGGRFDRSNIVLRTPVSQRGSSLRKTYDKWMKRRIGRKRKAAANAR